MEYTEIKNKSEKELHDMLSEERGSLGALRFKAHEQQLKDVRAIRKSRKAIARIMTALRTSQRGNTNA